MKNKFFRGRNVVIDRRKKKEKSLPKRRIDSLFRDPSSVEKDESWRGGLRLFLFLMSIAYFRFPIRWKNQLLPHATSPAVEFSQTSNIPRREKKPSISIIVAIFDLHSSFTKPLVPLLGRKRGRGATRDIISPTNLSYNSLSLTPLPQSVETKWKRIEIT